MLQSFPLARRMAVAIALAMVAGCSSGTTTLTQQPQSLTWRVQTGVSHT